MNEQLKKYFERYVDLSDEELKLIDLKISIHNFQPKEYLLREGEICRHKYFILEGLVKSFYINQKGTEKITHFALENWWVSNLESFVSETASQNSIQAIEKTSVLSICKEDLENLFTAIPKLERFFRIITENMLIAVQRKNEIYLQMRGKDLYFNFIKTFPEFNQRVPQYMIASYLEMTPEYLSELRKNEANSIS